jgi:phosphate transport system substrate-binding protein
MVLARDAIAVIMNPESGIQYFTKDDIRKILQGKFTKNLIPVFDGVKATSTVRFIIDSVLHGDTLGSNVVAARSSEEVIDYVSKTKDAVGFIGVSWIGNKDDTQQLNFLKKVKIIPLESIYNREIFVTPLQANIFNGSYPMVRDLVYILKEKHKGLGHGFADFMSAEKGQLIFRRAYLMPAQRDFGIRQAILKE